MSQHRALGAPGRARGVDDEGAVVESDPGRLAELGSLADDRLEVLDTGDDLPRPSPSWATTIRWIGRPAPPPEAIDSSAADEMSTDDPESDEQKGELGDREPGVERHEDGAEPGGREQGLDVGRMVVAQVGDPVADPDASLPERGGERIDPIREGPIGVLAVTEHESRMRARLDGTAAEPAGDTLGPGSRLHRRCPFS